MTLTDTKLRKHGNLFQKIAFEGSGLLMTVALLLPLSVTTHLLPLRHHLFQLPASAVFWQIALPQQSFLAAYIKSNVGKS